MTLSEYFNTQETTLPQELIYGQVFVADAPFVNHQRVLLKLAVALTDHVERSSAGEVFIAPIDVILDRDRALVVQPDLLFISNDRPFVIEERIYGAPDLVVEILSPHPRIGRIEERIERFVEYGVREIWVYHQPERRMDILTCEAGAIASRQSFGWPDQLESRVLPPFTRTLGSMLDAW
jgi:Uma2 family endonuclease